MRNAILGNDHKQVQEKQTRKRFSGVSEYAWSLQRTWLFFFGCFEKHPKVVLGALRDGFRAREVLGSFEKSTAGCSSRQVWLATAHSQLYRSYKVSPTLYQSDLRISNHRGHKFSSSLTLLELDCMTSSADRNRKFSERIFSTPAIFKVTSELFRSRSCSKTFAIFPAFSSRFVDFAIQFCFRCKFSFQREMTLESSMDSRSLFYYPWVKFDRGVIFLDESQSFATHRNQ